jgi:hypothetical protein
LVADSGKNAKQDAAATTYLTDKVLVFAITRHVQVRALSPRERALA